MRYVLDTNTVIHFLKGMGHVAANLLLTPPATIAVPSVVVHELEVGVLKSADPLGRRSQLNRLLDQLTILPFAWPEAEAAAAVRVALEGRGQPIGPFDVLIAGTAIVADAILVTRNVKEFGRVAELRLANWFDQKPA